MPRIIEINKGKLMLTDKKIEGFLERTVNSIGTSAKVDVPKRYIGKRAYVVIVKD
jgi:putative transposon-encoded protein